MIERTAMMGRMMIDPGTTIKAIVAVKILSMFFVRAFILFQKISTFHMLALLSDQHHFDPCT